MSNVIKAKELKPGQKYVTNAGMIIEAGELISDKNHEKFGYRHISVLEGEKKGKKLVAPPDSEFTKYVSKTSSKKSEDLEEEIEAPKSKKGKTGKAPAPKGKAPAAKKEKKEKVQRGPSKRDVILRVLKEGRKEGVTVTEIKKVVEKECETTMTPEMLHKNIILTISAMNQEGYKITREEISRYYLEGTPKAEGK